MSTSASEKENLLSITPPSGFFLRLSITQSLFKVFDLIYKDQEILNPEHKHQLQNAKFCVKMVFPNTFSFVRKKKLILLFSIDPSLCQ